MINVNYFNNLGVVMFAFKVTALLNNGKINKGEYVETRCDLSGLFEDEPPQMADDYTIHDDHIIENKSLQGMDVRVFFALCKGLTPKGWIFINQSEIATRLGITKQQVSNSIKKLKTQCYVHSKLNKANGTMMLWMDDLIASRKYKRTKKSVLPQQEDEQ